MDTDLCGNGCVRAVTDDKRRVDAVVWCKEEEPTAGGGQRIDGILDCRSLIGHRRYSCPKRRAEKQVPVTNIPINLSYCIESICLTDFGQVLKNLSRPEKSTAQIPCELQVKSRSSIRLDFIRYAVAAVSYA